MYENNLLIKPVLLYRAVLEKIYDQNQSTNNTNEYKYVIIQNNTRAINTRTYT